MGHFPSSGRYSGIFSDRAESGSLSSAFIARYLPAVEVKTVFIVLVYIYEKKNYNYPYVKKITLNEQMQIIHKKKKKNLI